MQGGATRVLGTPLSFGKRKAGAARAGLSVRTIAEPKQWNRGLPEAKERKKRHRDHQRRKWRCQARLCFLSPITRQNLTVTVPGSTKGLSFPCPLELDFYSLFLRDLRLGSSQNLFGQSRVGTGASTSLSSSVAFTVTIELATLCPAPFSGSGRYWSTRIQQRKEGLAEEPCSAQ